MAEVEYLEYSTWSLGRLYWEVVVVVLDLFGDVEVEGRRIWVVGL